MNDFTETMNSKAFRDTGEMCMVHIGERSIDMGNYYTDSNGNRVLITTAERANLYANLVSVPVYVLVTKECNACDGMGCWRCVACEGVAGNTCKSDVVERARLHVKPARVRG